MDKIILVFIVLILWRQQMILVFFWVSKLAQVLDGFDEAHLVLKNILGSRMKAVLKYFALITFYLWYY